MNPSDLAELLAEANRIRKAHPNDPLTRIDAWIAENAPGVNSYAQLRRMVEQPVTGAAAAQLNASPGQIVSDATRVGARPRNAAPQAAINSAAGQTEVRTQATEDLRNLTRAGLRGATLNFDDNLARMLGVGQAPGQMYSPEGQANYDQFRQTNPGLDMAAGMLASLPTGGMLGGAVKKALLKRAATQAPEALTAARILTAEGTVPSMIRGAGIGGAYGGLSAVGDDNSAREVALKTVGGAAVGAAIPGVLGGLAAGAAKLRPSVNAAQNIGSDIQQMGNVVVPAGQQTPVSGSPVTFAQKMGDLLNPARREQRVLQGLRPIDLQAASLAQTGRGASMTPLDADPSANGMLLTRNTNAIRQNQEAAGLSTVEALGQRGAQTRGNLQGDIADAYSAAGQSQTMPLIRRPSQGGGDPNLQMAQGMENAAGAARPIRNASITGAPRPSGARFSVAGRKAEIDAQTKAFANSQQGYAGLQPTIQAGSGGQGTSPEVLDQARLLLIRDANNVVDENTRKFIQQANDDFARLQGGPGENVPVYIKDVGKAVKRMNDFIAKARAPQPPPGTPGGIYVPGAKLAEIEQARDALIKYADDGFRGPQGQTFSDIQRRYALGKQASRDVQFGADLLDGKVPGEGELTAERARQLLDGLTPESKQNAYQGILSRQIEKLRGADRTDDTNTLLTQLVRRSTKDHRESALLQAAFPTPKAYQQVLNQQVLFDAAQQGVSAFKNTSPNQVQAAFDRLRASSPAAAEEFKRTLIGSLEDDIANPEAAQAFVKRAGADLRSDGGEWMTKFKIVFGKKGAEEMRQRLLLQARMQNVETTTTAAARNPAGTERSNLELASGPGNPVSAKGNVFGLVRGMLRPGSRQAVKTETVKLLTAQGPAGMQAFRDAVLRASRPVPIGRATGVLLPGMAGYGIGNPQDLQRLLEPQP